MQYLSKADLYVYIRQNVLEQITDQNDALLDTVEAACISMFEDYLIGRYDTVKVFLQYDEWDAAENYAADSTVRYQNKLYLSLLSDAGTTPGSDATIWKLIFTRSDKITLMLIDCLLYKLHHRVSSDQIPTHRVDAYEAAMEWLIAVNKGQINANLPFKDENEDGVEDDDSFRFGFAETNKVRQIF